MSLFELRQKIQERQNVKITGNLQMELLRQTELAWTLAEIKLLINKNESRLAELKKSEYSDDPRYQQGWKNKIICDELERILGKENDGK